MTTDGASLAEAAPMTVGGSAVRAAGHFDVVDPATGEVFATAPECSPAQLDGAFAAALGALAGWRRDIDVRRGALVACADLLDREADRLAPILTAEQGKPLANSMLEIRTAALWFRYFAALELPQQVVRDDELALVEVVRRPMGVVAAITPWNFPLALASWKLAPALLGGNTVVLKPSPFTPLTTLAVGALLGEVLPAGVLNVVTGSDPLGARMTEHPVPRKVSFTGSVATGRRVAAAAATDLKRVTLELGGNDAAIVLDDVDVAAVAPKLFWSAFANNGQVCSAIKRLYVAAPVADELTEALAELARTVKVGPGVDEGVQLGPVNNLPQHARVASLVSDAIEGGATVVAGGGPLDGPGYFFQPTVLTDVREGMRVVDEEQFGPVLPVLRFDDIADALRRANATPFGLSGSVWSADGDRAAAVAADLECGTSWVNAHLVLAPEQPFGGRKSSGLGVEGGIWGLDQFTEPQVLHRTR